MSIRVNGMLTSAVHPSFFISADAEVLSTNEVRALPDRSAISSGGLGLPHNKRVELSGTGKHCLPRLLKLILFV